jgi:hypothetical protein
MKKALLLICFFTTSFAFAQRDQPWKGIGIDSLTFADNYGSVYEYNFEHDQMQKSSHKCLAVFIGAKAFWLNNLSTYLQLNKWTLKDSKNGNDYMRFTLLPVAYVGKATPLVVTGVVNKKDRVSKVTITGKADDVIDLFIKYWELSKFSFNDLKKNKTIYEEYGSDKIIFSWFGVNPQITIIRSINTLMIPQG